MFKDYILTCLLCGRVETKGDVAEFHQHAIDRHEISIDDLEPCWVLRITSPGMLSLLQRARSILVRIKKVKTDSMYLWSVCELTSA